MHYSTQFDSGMFKESIGHKSCVVLDEANGCVGECMAGVSQYETTEYPAAQVHAFQEGFHVLAGKGFALVDGEEFPIAPGTSFLVPAGKPHSLRRAEDAEYVRVFWFHSA